MQDGSLVTLLGSPSPLTNSRLDDEGNAALALGLLGANDRAGLVPAVGRPTCRRRAQKSFYDLVPDGVWWALLQVGVAVLLLALWRARRLGRGRRRAAAGRRSGRPRPVEGRARLYRRNGARGQAARALRAGVRRASAAPSGCRAGSTRRTW